MPRILVVLALALSLAACGASPEAASTASAQTQAADLTAAALLAQTQTAGAPSATPVPSDTPEPTATATATTPPSATPTDTPEPTATDTATPEPSDTPEPTHTATAGPTNTKAPPAATAVPPSATPQPGPDFVLNAKLVRERVDGIGGQIDLALQVGFIDCVQLVDSYNYVVARRDITVAPGLAGPYAIYQAGVDKFVERVHDIYNNCVSFLADPTQAGGIPQQQWGPARLGVTEARDLLTQSIVAAGGTP